MMITRTGAELCSPHRDPPLFPQHFPPAGQARCGQLHPPEVRCGPGVLCGLRGSSHQDQQDIQDIQVTLQTCVTFLQTLQTGLIINKQ